MDTNRVDCLVEKSGLDVDRRRLVSPISNKAHSGMLRCSTVASELSSGPRGLYYGINFRLTSGVAQWLARLVRDEEAGGSSSLTPTIILTNYGGALTDDHLVAQFS